MRTDLFITRKILKNETEGKKVSRPIVRISIISIALTIAVNIVTLAIVTGFQNEVKSKISGFGSHAFVMNSGQDNIFECDPIVRDTSIYQSIKRIENVKNVQAVAYKPVLLQSKKNEIKLQLANGKDSTIVSQEMEGCVLKGVGADFDKSFFDQYLISGEIPDYTSENSAYLLTISSKIAKNLRLKLNDTIHAFFVKSQPVKREFVVAAIYETGLEEFDKKIVIGKIAVAQELNDWGIKTRLEVQDTIAGGYLIIRSKTNGGNGNYRYDWGKGWENYSGVKMCPIRDTVLRVIVSDYWSNIKEIGGQTSIPDTAYLKIKVSGNKLAFCEMNWDGVELPRKYLDDLGNKFVLNFKEKKIEFESIEGKGTFKNYIGGYEITLEDWNKIDLTVVKLKDKLEYAETEAGDILQVNSITESQRDVFVWLDFLNINVLIVVVLMILIGMINMSSALLVMILVKTNFIGIMKSMGASNGLIRKIFLYKATYLIIIGLFFGNLFGIGLCLLQENFSLFKLDPRVYYLSTVPIELTWWHIVALNLGTLIICICSMILPSLVITKISPSKAIKFN